MRFQGSIHGMPIQIYLDSGSSNNFLQPRLAHYLKLPIEPIQKFKVVVGNGSALMVEGAIKDLEVQIQGHSLLLPVFLLPVSRADLVLGAAWLSTLGAHISDYSTLTLKFSLGNQFITPQGESNKLPSPTQFNHMRRLQHTHAIAELYSLHYHSVHCPQDYWLDLPTNIDSEKALLPCKHIQIILSSIFQSSTSP